MSTILQQNLAREIVANATRKPRKNKKELVVSSGYSEVSAESSAHLILEEKGVKEELRELGFTEENAKNVIGEILLNKKVKPDTRINAAKEVFKVEGSYAPEKSARMQVNIEGQNVPNADLEALRQEFEEKLKARLLTS